MEIRTREFLLELRELMVKNDADIEAVLDRDGNFSSFALNSFGYMTGTTSTEINPDVIDEMLKEG